MAHCTFLSLPRSGLAAKNAAHVCISWRYHMETKLFVGNLPRSVTDTQLQELFERQGTVKSAEVTFERTTGHSRTYLSGR